MYKIYSLLSKKAQNHVKNMRLRDVLNEVYIKNNNHFTETDKNKLLAVCESLVEYNSTSEIEYIKSPQDVYNILKANILGKQQEEFYVICLNTKNAVVHKEMLFKGSLNSCIVDTKSVYSLALRCSAQAIIVAHNHPSGDLLNIVS